VRTPEGDGAGVVAEIRTVAGEPMMGDRLPCGCWMATRVLDQAFIFEPHDLACPYYRYVVDENARQGKPGTMQTEDRRPRTRP
jgi:hypothetical protein